MAAPMTPAEPTRDAAIRLKENAIKKRLAAANSKNKYKATADASAELSKMKKHGRHGQVIKKYNSQSILGADKGYAKSDYGVDKGAAIPYQIGTDTKLVTKSTDPKPGRANPKPKGTLPGWVDNAKAKARAGAIIRRSQAAGGNVKGL